VTTNGLMVMTVSLFDAAAAGSCFANGFARPRISDGDGAWRAVYRFASPACSSSTALFRWWVSLANS